MASRDHYSKLHVLLFPYMAAGHILPAIDLAKLFASRGSVSTTIVTTPANASPIQDSIGRSDDSLRSAIRLAVIPYPTAAVGLPDGAENVSVLSSQDQHISLFKGSFLLRGPFTELIREQQPDCIITDMFFPWTIDVADELGIPRLVFDGTGFFSRCAKECMRGKNPHEFLPRDVDSFVLPDLPHRIEMLKSNFRDPRNYDPTVVESLKRILEADTKSYGVIVNSFYELEPDYVEHFRKVMGRRAWAVGPLSLCNREISDRFLRGEKSSIMQDKCLAWLDNKKPHSVVYVSFGTLINLSASQMREIVLGLVDSGYPFILVARNPTDTGSSEWLSEGSRDMIGDRGLIIEGWAPQILILNHPAVGSFLTHCGWNSTLESVSAGIPMITWPLMAEQFYNEKLIVDILNIGVAVGVKLVEDLVGTEKQGQVEKDMIVERAAEITRAVNRMMDLGPEAEAMRERAKELAGMAKRALEDGGSSVLDLDNLISELVEKRAK